MKSIKFLTLLVVSLLFVSCGEAEQTEVKEETAVDQSISKIEVFNFHSTNRCMTCNAIEASTKYTLETYFTKERENKEITWQVINVDEKENEKIAEKYEVFGTALVLNVIKDGKENHINLTDFAFMNGNDEEVFAKELKATIEKHLKTL